ncbi:ImmA/IrrE family metallo-endopeptidase [Moorella sp. E306M]|uniref:ImmA/IrrE family metallo-endopeptidase n=1 Tax=Moorella sp. E306M TaxID=2572683 RepID=UPI0010FFBA95|nr:ImmA/IrrE family metallo-endopeptidase [Moorella sp. E306M]GEA17787.1 hypothetical protein E306M_09210 [Moorella sp. E306M]GEA17856.1 hypothetical protein E306M_09900 [Moorella sp. E306M]
MPVKINKVRYDYIRPKIAEFIAKQKINRLPVDPMQIIARNKWTVRTYDYYAKKHGVMLKDVIEAYGSEDAFTIYQNGLYSIAYNDKIRSPGRIRFSLMHEIGHIYLKHLEEFDQTILARGGLTDEEYDILETEADIFASETLAPSEVLLSLGWTNYSVIEKRCKLSRKAAKFKASRLFDLIFNWVYVDPRSPIIANFYDFIYQKKCNHCGYGFISSKAKYCPICGNKLIWGEGKMIYNDGYDLDENGRAIKCPRCDNEEINYKGDYCTICGTYLINKCIDKTEVDINGNEFIIKGSCGPVPGNARYCPICGSETTFYRMKLLAPWEKAKEILETQSKTAATKEDIEIDEDDLPF